MSDVLDRLYELTFAYQEWELTDEYSSFSEAERDFFAFTDKLKSEYNIQHIDHGGFRDVYTGGELFGDDTVIKIAKSGGITHNERAVNAWKDLSESERQYVADIIEWSGDYTWIVQERAYGRGDTREVGEQLSDAGYRVSDLDGGNVGVIDGNSVLVDLGYLY